MSSALCSVPDCDQIRYHPDGRKYPYPCCIDHMRLRWSERGRKSRRRQGAQPRVHPQQSGASRDLENWCSSLHTESMQWIEHVRAYSGPSDLLKSLRQADQKCLSLEAQVESLTAALEQITAERDRACQEIADLRQRSFAVPARNGNTPPDAKIFASSFGTNYGLLILEGRIVSRLPMPETERERLELVESYAAQGYWIAEAQ